MTRDAALHRIRLRHLQCFLAVAEARNLRVASETLAVSQPAVTKTIARTARNRPGVVAPVETG